MSAPGPEHPPPEDGAARSPEQLEAGSDPGARHAEVPNVAPEVASLADGDWHRLHPATPLLRGGIAFIAIVGIVIANLRERVIELFFDAPGFDDDPIDVILEQGVAPIVLLILLGVLLLCLLGFYLSWRMHTFRISETSVEVRSGILFRTNRKGRLDRVQGVAVNRPLLPRIFGTARLEIDVAGQDANVQLAYLSGRIADQLRTQILLLASGVRRADAEGARDDTDATAEQTADGAPSTAGSDETQGGSIVEQRLAEFLAPEFDASTVAPDAIVRVPALRLIASTVFSTAMAFFVLAIVGIVVAALAAREAIALVGILPFTIAIGSYLLGRVLGSLRYSIASTPDGIRIGSGVISVSNDTLPPGRIHSIAVDQPLIWRPFGWWLIRVNRASRSMSQASAQQRKTMLLPVGNRADVLRVLELIVPEMVSGDGRGALELGLDGRGGDEVFTVSPPRGRLLRWFSRRRNGFALASGNVLLRHGSIWRELVIVPLSRAQSVAVRRGPVLRLLDLAAVSVNTVAGPITPSLGAMDARDSERFFFDVADAAVVAAAADRSHRWGERDAVIERGPDEPAVPDDPDRPVDIDDLLVSGTPSSSEPNPHDDPSLPDEPGPGSARS